MNAIVPQTSIATAENWKDKKYYLWTLSPSIPLIGVGALALYQLAPTKLRFLPWTGPLLVHVIFPLFDILIGEDTSNPPDAVMKALEENPYYHRIVKAFIPLQYAFNVYAGYMYTRKSTPWLDKIGLIMSAGVINGVAINTGHELSHKKTRIERLLSLMALAPTGYGHFAVEHPMGHHKRVATPEDPASSRMGETFWEFLPRTVIGSFKSAIQIETARLKRQGKSFFSKDNELLQGWAMTGAYAAGMTALFGPKIIPFLAASGVYGFQFLEVVNYLEHYGLLRQKDESGKYERTQPHHSWNSNQVVTNLVLYQLQRHSDHHAYPTRSFQALRHFDETPQLPTGYAGMIGLAYIPQLWFKVMDKKVFDHYKGDLSKANIHPKARAKIFAKFGLKEEN